MESNTKSQADVQGDPWRKQAALLLTQLDETADSTGYIFWDKQMAPLPAVQAILGGDPEVQKALVTLTVERIAGYREALGTPKPEFDMEYANLCNRQDYPRNAVEVVIRLLRRKLPFTEAQWLHLLERTAHLGYVCTHGLPHLESLVREAEKFLQNQGVGNQMNRVLGQLCAAIQNDNAPERKLRERIAALRSGPRELPVIPGEAWSDAAIAALEGMDDSVRGAWVDLLSHCRKASGGKPSAKWGKQAIALLKALPDDSFKRHVLEWFPLVDKPRTGPMPGWTDWRTDAARLIIEPHTDILKGLTWCCGLMDDAEIARAVTALGVSAYKKVPGVGPRAVKVGNACVSALGAMPGMDPVGQLALLKVKIRFRTAQKEIDKALEEAAGRMGISREELEEMGVPAYGLTEVGALSEAIGEHTARLRVTGVGTTELTWVRADGKEQKSVPAAVKEGFADDLKEIQSAAKDIQKMLPAQRERLDGLFLARKRWAYAAWRQRYLDHPLLGVLARRLIWRFEADGEGVEGIWLDGRLVGVDDRPLKDPGPGATVELWHPIARPVEPVLAWREWLERHMVQQPFKQAHREVYLLTDAERQTGTYSNRFAAHIVRQHQFNALCAVRGWRNVLKLLVDDEFPPAWRDLPAWGLRAEFWTDGAGDDYGTDTNETGTFHYLATDQVRFFPLEAPQVTGHAFNRGEVATPEPLPLEQVPAMAFSEIMRDADLFVGVASVGNDPTWSDGGPDGRYRDYWQGYSFGDLSATARTRREVLQGLIPRLKIASRCSIGEKFLVVRGDLRTYKIHLGSGNILMEPNDEYLCIVPGRGVGGAAEKLFLPFEGDQTMAVILSKAFLLAGDAAIKDPTIVSQIGRR